MRNGALRDAVRRLRERRGRRKPRRGGDVGARQAAAAVRRTVPGAARGGAGGAPTSCVPFLRTHERAGAVIPLGLEGEMSPAVKGGDAPKGWPGAMWS